MQAAPARTRRRRRDAGDGRRQSRCRLPPARCRLPSTPACPSSRRAGTAGERSSRPRTPTRSPRATPQRSRYARSRTDATPNRRRRSRPPREKPPVHRGSSRDAAVGAAPPVSRPVADIAIRASGMHEHRYAAAEVDHLSQRTVHRNDSRKLPAGGELQRPMRPRSRLPLTPFDVVADLGRKAQIIAVGKLTTPPAHRRPFSSQRNLEGRLGAALLRSCSQLPAGAPIPGVPWTPKK